jgi:hypothetical protein
MNMRAKQLIELRENQSHKIQHLWCDAQKEDIQELIDLMEDIVRAAMSAKTSQGYELLENAKANFVEVLLDMSEKYRVVNLKDCDKDNKRKHTDTHTR